MQNASDNKNNNSTTNRDSSLRFVPEAEEHSPELQALFDRISDRIDDFCSSSTLPHVQVNRFVAGHLRKNDVADLKLAFVSPEALRESEEKNKLGGSTKLAGCSDAAAVWASKSAAEKAAYKEMEITSKKEQSKKRRRREGDAGEPETIKSEQYHSAIKAIKQRNTEAMVQNFGIHTICSLLLIPVISTCFLHLLFGVLDMFLVQYFV